MTPMQEVKFVCKDAGMEKAMEIVGNTEHKGSGCGMLADEDSQNTAV